ncbi:MAG TPA: hypothetical protein VF981_01425 [Gemmatimonadaceae bacterium]
MTRPVASALTALLLAVTGLAQAQTPRADGRRGVTATIGVGRGSAALTCAFCARTGQRSYAGTLSLERAVRPGIRAGVEIDWWWHTASGVTRSVLAGAPVVRLYPSGSGGFFLKAGVGIGRLMSSSDEEELGVSAVTGVAGAGYELRWSQQYAAVPYVSVVSGRGGTMRLNGARITAQGGLWLLQYGMALSFR